MDVNFFRRNVAEGNYVIPESKLKMWFESQVSYNFCFDREFFRELFLAGPFTLKHKNFEVPFIIFVSPKKTSFVGKIAKTSFISFSLYSGVNSNR